MYLVINERPPWGYMSNLVVAGMEPTPIEELDDALVELANMRSEFNNPYLVLYKVARVDPAEYESEIVGWCEDCQSWYTTWNEMLGPPWLCPECGAALGRVTRIGGLVQ